MAVKTSRRPTAKRYRAYFIRSEQFVTRTGPETTDFQYAAKNQYTGSVSWHHEYEAARAAAGREGEVTNALQERIDG